MAYGQQQECETMTGAEGFNVTPQQKESKKQQRNEFLMTFRRNLIFIRNVFFGRMIEDLAQSRSTLILKI